MTYTKITLIAFIALLPFFSNAQSSKLIGKPAPEIVFKEVLNDTKQSYKLSDFKGKLSLSISGRQVVDPVSNLFQN
jgi:hypothetical protein